MPADTQPVPPRPAALKERFAELAELAGGFIHEIKNRLSTLGLNLQLLAEDFQDPQSPRERRALERVQRLQNECERLVTVSNDFLRFARVNDLELTPANLGDVIEEMVDFFGPTARQANIEIKSYVPLDLPPVLLDREMFKQAILNLMLNAEEAMPEGGELTLQAFIEPAGRANHVADDADKGPQASRYVCLSLIDTGKGMKPEELRRIFRPFFSTRPGGTGLGLPTTRRIIEAHHGTIEVESEVNKGTRFTLRLPVYEKQAESAHHAALDLKS